MLPSFVSDNLFLAALLVLFGVLASVIVYLVARERHRDEDLEHFSRSVYEYGIQKAQRRAETIISRAIRQARDIFVSAELAGIKAVAQGKVRSRSLEKKYESALAEVGDTIQTQLQTDAARADKLVAELTASFEHTLSSYVKESAARLDKTLAEHERSVVEALAEAKDSSRARITETIEGGMATARTSIAEYETARKAIADEQLLDLVARTAEIALGETLSLEDHTRLLYRALEEARKEGFFKAEGKRERTT